MEEQTYEIELGKMESKIDGYRREIAALKALQLKMLTQIRDIDIGMVLECIEDRGRLT